jgi:hypothetical protein
MSLANEVVADRRQGHGESFVVDAALAYSALRELRVADVQR